MAERLEFIIGAKDEFSAAFRKLGGYLPSLKTAALAAAGGVAAFTAAAVANAKAVAESYDKVQKFSDRIGISTEALSRYQVVANFSGVTNETLAMGFQRMTRRIAEASQGTGVAVGALKELGISIGSIAGRAPDKQFEMIAEALDKVGSQGDKARLAMQFFDSEGVALLQTLTGGTVGLAAMRAEADRFGVVVSSKAGANAAAFNDSLYRMQLAFQGLRNYAAENLMPTITGLANRFAYFVADNRGAIIAFAEKAVQALGKFVEYSGYGVAVLIDSWRGLKMLWETLKIGFIGFHELILEGLDALVSKTIQVMEKLNFRGIFDQSLEKVREFKDANAEALDYLAQSQNEAWSKLNAIIDEGSATGKVKAFAESVRGVLAEIRAEGTAEPTGIAPFDAANLVKAQENIAQAKEDQQNALAELDALKQQYLMTDSERLDAWYAEQLNKYAGQKEALAVIDEIYDVRRQEAEATRRERDLANEQQNLRDRERYHQQFNNNLFNLQNTYGKKAFEAIKAYRISEAIIVGYDAAVKAWDAGMSTGGPWAPLVAAAYAAQSIAWTTAKIQNIRKQEYGGAAHGGMDYVPKEQTYLLDRGERVLSPRQNQDLTAALEGGAIGGGMQVETLNISIDLPNVSTRDSLLNMTRTDWEAVMVDKVVPAMRRVANWGYSA